MTKVEAIKALMENNGGVASWKYIYDNIENYYPPAKASLEWQAGIRGVLYREIRNDRNFKRIGFGTFALREYEQEKQIEEIKKDKIRTHSYIEGIMVELGNYEGFDTYCADPSAEFQENIFINQLATMVGFPEFTYSEINQIAKRIDVTWFNKKGYKFPKKLIEVVDSIGTLGEALNRLYQLKEFKAEFLVLHPADHKTKILQMIKREPYSILRDRFVVKDYDEVISFYNKRLELEKIKF